jgi:hypothetical protein
VSSGARPRGATTNPTVSEVYGIITNTRILRRGAPPLAIRSPRCILCVLFYPRFVLFASTTYVARYRIALARRNRTFGSADSTDQSVDPNRPYAHFYMRTTCTSGVSHRRPAACCYHSCSSPLVARTVAVPCAASHPRHETDHSREQPSPLSVDI